MTNFEDVLKQRIADLIAVLNLVNTALYDIADAASGLSMLTPEARAEFDRRMLALIRANTPVLVDPAALLDLNSMYQAQYLLHQAQHPVAAEPAAASGGS